MSLTDADLNALIEVFEREYRETKNGRAALRALAVSAMRLVKPTEHAQGDLFRGRGDGSPACIACDCAMCISDVVRVVAGDFGVSVPRMRNPANRASVYCRARRVAAGVLRRKRLSLPAIAEALGMANHTSVLGTLRSLETAPDLLAKVNEITARVDAQIHTAERAPFFGGQVPDGGRGPAQVEVGAAPTIGKAPGARRAA